MLLISCNRSTKLVASVSFWGYSQSMSRPSKPRSLTRLTAVDAKLDLPEAVEAGWAKLAE